MTTTIWTASFAILFLNLPFGYWRAGLRALTPAWFAAVHLPVLLAVGLRLVLGLGLRWSTLPLFVAAFVGGQWLGGRLRTVGPPRGR